MSIRLLRAGLPGLAIVLVPLGGSVAHEIVGNRLFPATLGIDDPGVNDEMSLPTVANFKTGDDPSFRQRDFSGACGLFSVVLKPVPLAAVHAFLDALTLFGIGDSWGGFESLAIPFNCAAFRSATRWAPGGPTVRFHIGLEDVDDLIRDLERGFAALAAAR